MLNFNQINCFFRDITLVAAVIALSITTIDAQLPMKWEPRAPYGGGAIYDPFHFVVGNKAYVGSGRSLTPTANRNDFWEYDPATDVWTQKAMFPGTGRYGARGFAINNYGYAGTGWDPSPKSDFYRYDPVLNVWTPVANFAGSARYTSSTFEINGFGYLGLGYSGCKSDFWRYNPLNNSWTQVAVFPGGARQAATSFVINNDAYVGLGACTGSAYNDFYKYDAVNNSWAAIQNFPGQGRNSSHSFVLNGKAYVGLGNNYLNTSQPYTIFNDFWEYDPITLSWSQIIDFTGGKRFCGVGFTVAGRAYVGLGSDTVFNVHYTSDMWEFIPDTTVGLNSPQASNNFSIYPNPVTDYLNITLHESVSNSAKLKYKIYDISGKLISVAGIPAPSDRITISLPVLTQGVYFVGLFLDEKMIGVEKMFKK